MALAVTQSMRISARQRRGISSSVHWCVDHAAARFTTAVSRCALHKRVICTMWLPRVTAPRPNISSGVGERTFYQHIGRRIHMSSGIYICSKHDNCGVGNNELTPEDQHSTGTADFRDSLDALVMESIQSEDMGSEKGLLEGEADDDISVSQSGKLLLFPWRRWSSQPDTFPDIHVDGDKMTEKGGAVKHPSVTGILQKTMPPNSALALLWWESFMIKKMGLSAFQKLKREMFDEGHQLHNNIGHVLLNRYGDVKIGDGIKGYWSSIKDCLPDLASDSPILECHTTHPFLRYHGYADCITQYRGEPCVVEFKTSRKPKKTLNKCFDNPLQVAAYLGALNFDPRYQLKIEKALLAIAYKDGSPASLHVMDSRLCDVYWKKWLRRLQEYRELESRHISSA